MKDVNRDARRTINLKHYQCKINNANHTSDLPWRCNGQILFKDRHKFIRILTYSNNAQKFFTVSFEISNNAQKVKLK